MFRGSRRCKKRHTHERYQDCLHVIAHTLLHPARLRYRYARQSIEPSAKRRKKESPDRSHPPWRVVDLPGGYPRCDPPDLAIALHCARRRGSTGRPAYRRRRAAEVVSLSAADPPGAALCYNLPAPLHSALGRTGGRKGCTSDSHGPPVNFRYTAVGAVPRQAPACTGRLA
jgi:hypothetical protein